MGFCADPEAVADDGNLAVSSAQELQPTLPEAVKSSRDGKDIHAKDIYTIRQDAILPLLVKAVQEPQAEIDALKTDRSARLGQRNGELWSLGHVILVEQ